MRGPISQIPKIRTKLYFGHAKILASAVRISQGFSFSIPTSSASLANFLNFSLKIHIVGLDSLGKAQYPEYPITQSECVLKSLLPLYALKKQINGPWNFSINSSIPEKLTQESIFVN